MRAVSFLLLAGALVSAGCLGASPSDPGGDGDTSTNPSLTVMQVTNVSTRWPGAEPVVDLGPDGHLVLEGIGSTETEAGGSRNVNRVWGSMDGGNWTDITPPFAGNESSNDGYVAVGPEGAIYAANVFGLTFQLFKSTDQGESWTPLNVPRVPAAMHRHWIEPVTEDLVHVTVEALDPGAGSALLGGPTLENATLNPANRGMYHFKSTDGGETWSTPQRIDPNVNYVGQSNMAVSPDGERVHVVRYVEEDRRAFENTYEDGLYYLVSSTDGGDTWERRDLWNLNGTIGSALTSLAMDPAGTLHFAWAEETEGTSRTHLATSTDGGETWTKRVLDLSDGVHAMPFIATRDAGQLGIVWFHAPGNGTTGSVDAPWHMRAALLTNATSANPTLEEVRVTPWTVHEGSICVRGPACGSEGDRRLLDYPWITFGPEGDMHVAWSSTMWEEPSAFPGYGRVVVGSTT